MARRRKKKKSRTKDLHDATPQEVAEAFAGEVQLLSGDAAEAFDGEVISSGLRSLDSAIGIGGFPRGRVVEIFGPESSGKTALALYMIGRVQKEGGKGAIIDVENALQLSHAKQVGVSTDELIISQPDSGERAMKLVLNLVRTRAADIIVVDSVAMLQPLKEQDKGIEGFTMGGQAALMSKSMRFVKRAARRSNVLVIFINQIRYKIGVMFGNPETTPGGMALRFAADIRIRIKADKAYKKRAKTLGFTASFRVVKNKISMPFQTGRIRLIYGKGWRSLKSKKENEKED